MTLQTGENEQALRKILDMTRLIAIVVLFIHCYYYCYGAFREWGLVSVFTDRLLANITRSGLFGNFHLSKLVALGFLVIYLFGARGRKNEKLNSQIAFAYIISGLLTYFISCLVLCKHSTNCVLFMKAFPSIFASNLNWDRFSVLRDAFD